MSDLVTIGEAKQFMSLDDNCDDGKLRAMIGYVSAGVESYLGRSLAQAEYREWYDGPGGRCLRLAQWPVTRLYQVANETQDLGYLTYAGTSQEAYASSDGTTLTLVDSAATDITLASYPTGTTLKAAVDAVTGWTMTLYTSDAGALDSRKLRPFHDYASDNQRIDLEVPEDCVESRVSNRSEWLIEGVFPEGASNIFVWYRAGYATLPDALKFPVLQILRDAWFLAKKNRDITKGSESLGDYSYDNAKAGDSGLDLSHIIASYGNQLSAFKRVEFA
jgi:hypothetical protein